MKRMAVVAAFSIISLSSLATTQAVGQAAGQGTVSAFCRTYRDLGLTHGACVAYFTNRNIVPHDASICKDEGIQGLLGVKNQGQCVKQLEELRR